MDEISMFTALRPGVPADIARAREAARKQLVDVLGAPAVATTVAPQPARRHRMLAVGGVITAAAAAALVVPAMLPGSATGTFITKAWAVERRPDGTVTVSFHELAIAPVALQRALRADGVHAFVRVMPVKSVYVKGVGKVYYRTCSYSGISKEPPSIQHAVVAGHGASQSAVQSWRIRPSAMPGRSSLLITLWSSSAASALLNPVVLRTHQPPTCVPARPPA